MNKIKDGKYLITGTAGFIGYHLTGRLLAQGLPVIGIDNLNDYYDVSLKEARLSNLKSKDFTFIQEDIANKERINAIFRRYTPDYVVNLAAQAGVRYSLENPDAYIQSNVIGFYNILEACRHNPVKHLVYASSSSVYGANKKVPFEETDFVDNPISLYAATKKSNELMAYTYSHLYNMTITGLRFFTVYGPFGRPDMAYFKFTDKYFAGDAIRIFNDGDFKNDLLRDFTYIDDVVEGLVNILAMSPTENYSLYNLGNNCPVKLMDFIEALERALSIALGKQVTFNKSFEPMQPGDVPATYASIDKLYETIGFRPSTPIDVGLQQFINWYVDYYNKR